MRAGAGATIYSLVYLMRGKEQPLLGLMDAQRLGIIQMNMKGVAQKKDRVVRLEKLEKQPAVKRGIVSGGQTQREIDMKMENITDGDRQILRAYGVDLMMGESQGRKRCRNQEEERNRIDLANVKFVVRQFI